MYIYINISYLWIILYSMLFNIFNLYLYLIYLIIYYIYVYLYKTITKIKIIDISPQIAGLTILGCLKSTSLRTTVPYPLSVCGCVRWEGNPAPCYPFLDRSRDFPPGELHKKSLGITPQKTNHDIWGKVLGILIFMFSLRYNLHAIKFFSVVL